MITDQAVRRRDDTLGYYQTAVERTIAHLEGETRMDAKELFEGFTEEEQARYSAEAETRWGESVLGSAAVVALIDRWYARSAGPSGRRGSGDSLIVAGGLGAESRTAGPGRRR